VSKPIRIDVNYYDSIKEVAKVMAIPMAEVTHIVLQSGFLHIMNSSSVSDEVFDIMKKAI